MQNKITKIFFLIAIFLMLPHFAFAAPSIAGVSGTVSDGNNVTISGSSFGTNSAVGTSALEFLGGKNGPIESGTSGGSFTRTNWYVDTEWNYNMQYSTDNVPWGTKVLQMTGAGGQGNIELPMYYIFPSAVTSSDHLFVSWWQRTTSTGDGQYKIIRFSPFVPGQDTVPAELTIQDADGQDCWFFHNNAGGNQFVRPLYSSSLWPGFSPATPQSTWQRMDLDITTSGSANGSVNFTGYTPGSAVQTSPNSSWQTHYSGLNWNFVVWQNYFGTDGLGSMSQGDVWLKDIYISHGTDARVELCDNANWANRQTCFVQPASAWSATGATITLNQGSFASSTTKYLYIVDSTGTANTSGYAVTLGSGSSDTTPPAAPSGLSVL